MARTALRVVVFLLLATVVSVTTLTAASPAQAATHGCYGSGCNGLDPAGRCDGDAMTVGAMHVNNGMLELRWSPSCVANWGRYTPYGNDALWLAAHGNSIYARVTVWNPGKSSYGVAHSPNFYGSSWSKMTDGTLLACTGVEVFHIGDHADMTSLGWQWGPCR
jgi:hypothetical protein